MIFFYCMYFSLATMSTGDDNTHKTGVYYKKRNFFINHGTIAYFLAPSHNNSDDNHPPLPQSKGELACNTIYTLVPKAVRTLMVANIQKELGEELASEVALIALNMAYADSLLIRKHAGSGHLFVATHADPDAYAVIEYAFMYFTKFRPHEWDMVSFTHLFQYTSTEMSWRNTVAAYLKAKRDKKDEYLPVGSSPCVVDITMGLLRYEGRIFVVFRPLSKTQKRLYYGLIMSPQKSFGRSTAEDIMTCLSSWVQKSPLI